MRSVAAYTFSEAYRELDAYLKIANYTMVAKLALSLDSETISSFKSELASLVGGYAAESQRLGEVLYNSDLGVPRPDDDK